MDNSSKFDPIVVVKDTANNVPRPNFFKRIRAPFSRLSMPNKKIAGALVALLLVFGVGLGVFLAQRQTQLRPRASDNGVDLALNPSTLNAAVNQEFNLDVVLDAKQASASAAQVKITYDSQKLQLVSTTLSSYMPITLQTPQTGANSVEFVVGTSTPQGGSGTLATLRFKPLVDMTNTTVNFDANNTVITVLNLDTNQAGDLTPANITIGATGQPSASPVAVPAGFNPDPAGTLKNGLVAFWKMDETSGTTSVDSVNGFNATQMGTSVTDGKIGKGQTIGTTNSALSVTPNQSFSTDTVTVAGWVKPVTFGTDNYASIFNYRPTTNLEGITLEYAGGQGSGQLQCQVFANNTAGTLVSANATSPTTQRITANVWNFVACSYDGTTLRLYINGNQVATGTAAGKMKRSSNMKIELGRNIVSNESLNGGLDEFGYWNRALTSQEVTALYNSGQGNTYGSGGSSTTQETSLSIDPHAPVNVNQQFAVTLKARSDVENANLFVAKMTFPANLLEVVSVDDTGSFVSSWAEQFYDNTTGQISLVGGVPNPGYKTSGTGALMATINFRAKSAGTAALALTNQSQVFSNATNQNILQVLGNTSVQINGGTGASPSPAISPSPIVSPSPVVSPSVQPSPSNCATLKGDGNGDCQVNLTDLSIMLSNFSATNPVPSGKQLLDFNDDNRINSFDFSAMADKLFQLGIIKRRS